MHIIKVFFCLAFALLFSSCNTVPSAGSFGENQNRYEDSPFGLSDLKINEEYISDLGAHWTRLSGGTGAVWDRDEPTPTNGFEWRVLDGTINGLKCVTVHRDRR